MSLATLIRSMAEAGATPEAIALAVEAIEAVQGRIDAQKEAARDKKRRQRAGQSQDITGTVPGQVGDTAGTVSDAPLAPSLSPQTPQTHPHTPGDITTREGVGAKASQLRLAKPNGFAAFWEAYPRKIGKVAAEKAFDRALRAINQPDPLGIILAGLERAKSSRAFADPEFIPHPTTWLNRGSWDDQPTEVAPLRPQGPRHERPFADQRQAAREDSLRNMHAGAMAALNRRLG